MNMNDIIVTRAPIEGKPIKSNEPKSTSIHPVQKIDQPAHGLDKQATVFRSI